MHCKKPLTIPAEVIFGAAFHTHSTMSVQYVKRSKCKHSYFVLFSVFCMPMFFSNQRCLVGFKFLFLMLPRPCFASVGYAIGVLGGKDTVVSTCAWDGIVMSLSFRTLISWGRVFSTL